MSLASLPGCRSSIGLPQYGSSDEPPGCATPPPAKVVSGWLVLSCPKTVSKRQSRPPHRSMGGSPFGLLVDPQPPVRGQTGGDGFYDRAEATVARTPKHPQK